MKLLSRFVLIQDLCDPVSAIDKSVENVDVLRGELGRCGGRGMMKRKQRRYR